MRPKKKNGLKEIAQAAGVSIVSVSNALNGRKGISREKSEKILEIAHSLGYSVNTLSNKASKTKYKFTLWDKEKYWYEIFCKAAGKYNAEILLNDDEDSNGAIIADRLNSSELTALMEKKEIPLVGVMFSDFDVNIDYVVDDGFHDAARAVKLLCDKGCRKVAVAADIEGEDFTYRQGQVTDRILGAYCQLQTIGNELKYIDFSNIVAASDYRQFFHAKKLPDGIICIGSKSEKALFKNFEEKKIRVPEDIRIVGCGMADENFSVPAVVCDKGEVAERAIEVLLHKLKNNTATCGITLVQGRCTALIRESNEIE